MKSDQPSAHRSAGKAAFVSGASSGLGLESAKLLAKAGFKVYGGARSFPPGLAAHPASFKTVQLDVLSLNSAQEALRAAGDDAGSPVEILVNCAGRGLAGAVEDSPVAEAQELFDLNFFGAVRMIQAALPGMRANGSGLIVNIGSLSARVPLPYQAFYSASKAALAALSDALAAELRPFGIRVALVEPGDFSSGFTAKRRRLKKSSPCYDEAGQQAMLAGYERSELAAAPAAKVARRIAAIALAAKPRFRYAPAATMELLGAAAKSFMPKELFERLLKSNYLSKPKGGKGG